jgi:hypothetical protein
MGDSMSTIINATTTNGVVIQPDNSGSLQLATNSGTTAVTISTAQNVGIGTTSPAYKLDVQGSVGSTIASKTAEFNAAGGSIYSSYNDGTKTWRIGAGIQTAGMLSIRNQTDAIGAVNIDSSGNVLVAKTTTNSGVVGINLEAAGAVVATRTGDLCYVANRLSNDGTLISFRQDSTEEGTISVSGTTVSYNGGHLSRWSQFDNETTKVEVYRGTVLESVDTMCVWEKDGQPLPNEQATKTIVSTTVASKAVAGVFDRYDEDDEDNPYDFYVAQSGDFVIRIAQGVTVQNGDLLESAGDGTAKPQADDICRSSTIAKVTSNYVSATYEDGSYCVPCILMIG